MDAILYGQKGGGKLTVPVFHGKSRAVPLKDDWSAGFIELYSSGTLKWAVSPPETVDLFCVGGGGGGLNGDKGATGSPNYDNGYPGAGGGGGYTTTAKNQVLSAETSIIIGTGGSVGGAGGTTSIGSLCTANGGQPGTYPYSNYAKGGSGGSGGGGYTAAGGSNGGNSAASSVLGYDLTGAGQGTSTKDLLDRIHAGGGAGGQTVSYNSTSYQYTSRASAAGGTSDFAEGAGGNGSYILTSSSTNAYSGASGYGGGGYGGGGGAGGGCASGFSAAAGKYSGGAGGQGFAMIAWGDYRSILGLE